MIPQFSWSNKSFPTAATPVSVVVCVVADNVVVHGGLMREPCRTERAAVWPFSRMFPNMYSEMVPLNEPGRTHLALVCLIAVVGFSMFSVMRYLVKRGAALLTLADDFPCVDTFVHLKFVPPYEGLPTNVTNVRLESTVRLKVPRQIILLRKRLSTVITTKWPLSGVSYLVSCHSTRVVCGVLAQLTPVPAVTVVAVTLPHAIVQTILLQTGKVAVGTVEHFT